MYFSKKSVRSVQWGLRRSPRSWGIFENFCVKSNLTSNCKLRKNGEAGRTGCSLNNFVGEQLLPCSTGSRAYDC